MTPNDKIADALGRIATALEYRNALQAIEWRRKKFWTNEDEEAACVNKIIADSMKDK